MILFFFISLIVGRKFDKRNAYWKRYGLLKTNFKVYVAYTNRVLSKKTKKRSEMKILTKIYQQNLDRRTESIEIGICEHGTLSSDSMK